MTGFWAPSIGSKLTGVLHAYVTRSEGSAKPFYVFDVESLTGQVRTSNGVAVSAERGARVGVSSFSNLRGLHMHLGQRMELHQVGEETLRSGRSMKVFDVEIFDDDANSGKADAHPDGDDAATSEPADEGESFDAAPF